MSEQRERARVSRNTGPKFRPVAVLGLLYFAAFFFLFAMLLVVPELAQVLETAPADPDRQAAAAKEAVHAVAGPRLPVAAALALLAAGAGAHFKLLPGFRG